MRDTVFSRLVVVRLVANSYICVKMRQTDVAKSGYNRIVECGFGDGSGGLFPLRSFDLALPALPVSDADRVAVSGVWLATSDSFVAASRYCGGVAI